jgi:hypothetical protein
MPLLLPAIQAAREAAVELESDEGEFVFGTELPAVQDGTINTMFFGESLLPPRSLDGANDPGTFDWTANGECKPHHRRVLFLPRYLREGRSAKTISST